jgi:hypothetical protein
VYRSWVALVVSGLLAGLATVSLFVGFVTPPFLALAVVSGVGAYLAYRYAADRMVQAVYAEVGGPEAGAGDGAGPGPAADGGTDVRAGTAERADSATARNAASEGEYDEWTWVDVEADDPFWSDDEDDWEDPWEANTVNPEEAAGGKGDWRARRGSGDGSERGRWWEERDGSAGRDGDAEHGRWWERMGDEAGEGRGASPEPTHEYRTVAAYEVLGLEPGAGPEAVRAAYRERVKEAHPDTPGGGVKEFIRVREAYEYLRGRLSGTEAGED